MGWSPCRLMYTLCRFVYTAHRCQVNLTVCKVNLTGVDVAHRPPSFPACLINNYAPLPFPQVFAYWIRRALHMHPKAARYRLTSIVSSSLYRSPSIARSGQERSHKLYIETCHVTFWGAGYRQGARLPANRRRPALRQRGGGVTGHSA